MQFTVHSGCKSLVPFLCRLLVTAVVIKCCICYAMGQITISFLDLFKEEWKDCVKRASLMRPFKLSGFWINKDYRFHLICCIAFCKDAWPKKNLAAGREAHHLIVKTGFQSNLFLGRTLIRMFALCGALSDANDVFHQLTKPDVSAWTAIISVNSKLGQDDQAAKLYQQMQESSVAPDGHAFVAVLKSCMAAKEMTIDSQNVI